MEENKETVETEVKATEVAETKEVVEKKEKNNSNNTPLLIIIVILLLAILAVGGFYVYNEVITKDEPTNEKNGGTVENNTTPENTNNNTPTNDTNKQSEEEKYLAMVPKISEIQAQGLGYNALGYSTDAYSGNKETASTLDKRLLLAMAWEKVKDQAATNQKVEVNLPFCGEMKPCYGQT